MPHSKKRSFIRSSPLAYVVVPLALAAVTAALLAALSFVLLQPYQMMLGWFLTTQLLLSRRTCWLKPVR